MERLKFNVLRCTLFLSPLMFALSCSGPMGFKGKSSVGGSEPGSQDQAEESAASDVFAGGSVKKKENPFGEDFNPDKVGDDTNLDLVDHDVLVGFPEGEEQLQKVCARGGMDKVRKVFCTNPPTITSLLDLQKALGLNIVTVMADNNANGTMGNPAFSVAGNSTSLVARFTTPMNPRVIINTPKNMAQENDPYMVGMAFVRGEQFVEIIAQDEKTMKPAFFLAKFEQDCNASAKGCGAADLLTPRIEENWRSFTLYEDVDIKNTIVDCKQCHQPSGPTGAKIALFPQFAEPWTHFMRDNTEGGRKMLEYYYTAHDKGETYAGIPGIMISASDPHSTETLCDKTNADNVQPFIFPTVQIEGEVKASGQSATWQALRERSVRGEIGLVPFYKLETFDATKFSAMATAYRDFMAGASSDLPDIRNTVDVANLRGLGFMVKEQSTAEEILVQACARCHNDRLDQTISRANFNVNLAKMSREQKDKAIERIKLPDQHLRAMPPRRFSTLTNEEKELLINLLQK